MFSAPSFFTQVMSSPETGEDTPRGDPPTEGEAHTTEKPTTEPPEAETPSKAQTEEPVPEKEEEEDDSEDDEDTNLYHTSTVEQRRIMNDLVMHNLEPDHTFVEFQKVNWEGSWKKGQNRRIKRWRVDMYKEWARNWTMPIQAGYAVKGAGMPFLLFVDVTLALI